jgi:hypothetical protein
VKEAGMSHDQIDSPILHTMRHHPTSYPRH